MKGDTRFSAVFGQTLTCEVIQNTDNTDNNKICHNKVWNINSSPA